jgi:hypothetical protein
LIGVSDEAADRAKVRGRCIDVRHLPGHDLITSIEFLSDGNKHGEGVAKYRHQQRTLTDHGVHVVEIDLLRGGARTELAVPLPPGDYYAVVFRAN